MDGSGVTCLMPWEHFVDVHYPPEKHGRVSNNAKLSTKESFLKFVDNNSQANSRCLDSRNLTHYQSLKLNTAPSAYSEKVKTSLVCEFTRYMYIYHFKPNCS